jgi:diguanylate cyclase (GGDEF)-like protein
MLLLAHLDLLLLAALAGGLVVSLRSARKKTAAVEEQLERTRGLLGRAEAQVRDSARIIARMRTERGVVANLALSLPHLVQELNNEELKPRKVPDLILSLVDALFQAGQVVYYAARTNSPAAGRELRLVAQAGLVEVPEALERVPFGEGKLGWVAERRVDMLADDWMNPVRTDGRKIEDNFAGLKLDIVGPLVHGAQLLGVLGIGQLGIRPQDEKLMFQLVTNLGAMALVNSEQRARLNEQATTDGLTGLLNKRYFIQHDLAQRINLAEREARPLSVFIFDIDHFKVYNDTNGHPAGDELLRGLGEILRQSLRPGDACCRYGGEEFVVAMSDVQAEEAMRVADRLRALIAAHVFPHEATQPSGDVTISGGVASFPRDGTSAQELIRHADLALYESKRAGRNRVTRYRGIDIGDADDATGFDLVVETESAPRTAD